jgi:hypothetical protein
MDCMNCKHLQFIEDRTEDCRPPHGNCLKDQPIFMFEPLEYCPVTDCSLFEEGEPDYV